MSVCPQNHLRETGADGPMVLADCALDETCSFLAVSTAGSEVSCDFYGWTSDSIACTTSAQVSPGSCVGFLHLVPSVSDMLWLAGCQALGNGDHSGPGIAQDAAVRRSVHLRRIAF